MTALSRDRAALLVVDIQERLAPAMPEEILAQVLRNTTILIEAAKRLGLPILVSQQYPKGLGPTVAAIESVLPPTAQRFDKVEFSAAGVVHPHPRERDQYIIAGMETHICVFQTARDLVEKGFEVFLLADAVLSRSAEDRRVGFELCKEVGARVTTVESALFDMLGRAGSPEFKLVSAAVK